MAGPEAAYKYKTGLYLAASASAEFLADIALCPFEAIKVRMQGAITAPYKGTFDGFSKITAAEGVGGLYKGLYPLWGRQIPYTMMKFASFENIVEMIYRRLPGRKEDYGKAAQTGVSFVGGYLAGILCAVVSHPADVMVSKLNAYRKPGEPFGAVTTRIYKDIGFMGLWNGLAVRIFMIGTLTGLQWMIYVSATDHVLGGGGGGTGTDRDRQGQTVDRHGGGDANPFDRTTARSSLACPRPAVQRRRPRRKSDSGIEQFGPFPFRAGNTSWGGVRGWSFVAGNRRCDICMYLSLRNFFFFPVFDISWVETEGWFGFRNCGLNIVQY